MCYLKLMTGFEPRSCGSRKFLRQLVQRFRLPYGDWFVGFSDTPSEEARAYTAGAERPSLSPITRVGVFCPASVRSWRTSGPVHRVPEFLVLFIKTS